jgi:hypothetical protein
MDHNLKKYATDIQWDEYCLYCEHKSYTQVAKILNKDRTNIRRSINALISKAAKQGYSPDHDMTHAVPDGYIAKGISTYYNADGIVTGQWVKSASDKERNIQILIDRLEQGSLNYKPFKPTPYKEITDENMLSLLTITDFHLGMYSWSDETGDDWDVAIARDVFLNSINDMISACPKSEVGVLNQLGDFLHFDSLSAITPASGHLLDADTRYGKLVDMSMEVMTEAIKIMLKRFKKVIVVQAEGNHDMAGSVWLRKHIKHMFSEDPRVEVMDIEFPYYAMLWGEIMLAFHHGHKMKMGQLQKLFSSEPRYRAIWGAAKHSYIHTGHMHHERVVEDAGAIVEQHPTLSGRDAYAARGGWVSQRGAKVITYHKTEGETHRFTVRPRIKT